MEDLSLGRQALAEAAEGLLRVRERHGQEITVRSISATRPLTIRNMALRPCADSRARLASALLGDFARSAAEDDLVGDSVGEAAYRSPCPTSTNRHLVVIGANPVVSNGSLMTAPGMPKPLAGAARARRQAGGRRSAAHRKLRLADEHFRFARVPTRSSSSPWYTPCSRRILVRLGRLELMIQGLGGGSFAGPGVRRPSTSLHE